MTSEQSTASKRGKLAVNIILVLIMIVAVPLLFTTNPDLTQHRLQPLIWNMGHIILFFAITWLTLNMFPVLHRLGLFKLLLLVSLIVFEVGIAIEAIQLQFARETSWADIYKNCLGASLAIIFYPGFINYNPRFRQLAKIGLVALIIAALIPLSKNTADYLFSLKQFPVLSNFETPFERERWSVGQLTSLESDNRVLSFTFEEKDFSSLEMMEPPRDWNSYHCFQFRFHNATTRPINLVVRVDDVEHDANGLKPTDRFNQGIVVNPGWNQYSISLDSIRAAPLTRSMDLSQVARIIFFTKNLKTAATLSLDDVELSSTANNCPGTGLSNSAQ